MRLTAVKIKNFRGYRDEVTVTCDDITAFVGKNDIGKSSVLEALDIFFNDGKGTIKIDRDDINKYAVAAGDTIIEISACFSELPESVVIDATYLTTLKKEYLLNADEQLGQHRINGRIHIGGHVFCENQQEVPCLCSQGRTDSSCQAGSVSQNQIR